MHSDTTINIHSFCDEFLEAIRLNLGLPKSSDKLYRDLRIEFDSNQSKHELNFYDFEGKMIDSIKNIKFDQKGEFTGVDNLYRPSFDYKFLKDKKEAQIEFYIDQGREKIFLNLSDLDFGVESSGTKFLRFWWSCEEGTDIKFDKIELLQ